MTHWRSLVALAACGLALAACGGGNGTPTTTAALTPITFVQM